MRARAAALTLLAAAVLAGAACSSAPLSSHLGVTATTPLFPGFTMNALKYPGVLV
jgi:hypothetical protein